MRKRSAAVKSEKAMRKKQETLNQQKQKLEKELRESGKLVAQGESNNRDLKTQLEKKEREG